MTNRIRAIFTVGFAIFSMALLSHEPASAQERTNRSIHRSPRLTPDAEGEVARIMKKVEERWVDRHGFLNLNPGRPGQLDNENPVLFTSEYYYLLKRLGVLRGAIRKEHKNRIRRMIDKLRLERGLFNRVPGRHASAFYRHFSRDEQIGLVTLDWAFDWELGFARELYGYGRGHGYNFQNRTWSAPGQHHRTPYFVYKGRWTPAKRPSFKMTVKMPRKAGTMVREAAKVRIEGQRTPAFRLYLRGAAGKPFRGDSPTDRAGSVQFRKALEITTNRSRGETSGKILAYLRAEVLWHTNAENRRAVNNFLARMKRVYGPHPLAAILRIYFRNPDHPLRRLSALL